MIKRFCDVCGSEKVEVARLEGGFKGVHFQVLVGSLDEDRALVWNRGDFCAHCIIDAVKSLDDREPKKEALT